MDEVWVVNVVGGGSIGRELNLSKLSADFPRESVQYNPETFAAVVIRYKDPKATITLYSTGKYSLAGAPSIRTARSVNDQFKHELQDLLEQNVRGSFEIRYIVATADLHSTIDLNSAFLLLGPNKSEYEPEQFPALFYRPPGENWFASIFSSGKIVINGCRSREHALDAYETVKEKLSPIL